MAMAQHSFLSLGRRGFHRLAYTDWGDPQSAHLVLCVHGLSRNSRDFDFLANALQPRCRVACLDVVGRGDSAWLDDPADYRFGTYLADAAAWIARVTTPRPSSFFSEWQRRMGLARVPERPQIDWVGTSMGGLIGLLLAAKAQSPIRRLVLNDVGPLVPWQALLRLSGHIGQTRFATQAQAQAHLRAACASFGIDDEAHWAHLFAHSIAPEGAAFALRYDPALGQLRRSPDPELPLGPNFMRGVDLWRAWEAIDCPVLVLRGAQSDVLLPDTVQRMRRKPGVQVLEFEGVGHAPALMNAEQIGAVRDFLLHTEP